MRAAGAIGPGVSRLKCGLDGWIMISQVPGSGLRADQALREKWQGHQI
jgi:hypothetical protein